MENLCSTKNLTVSNELNCDSTLDLTPNSTLKLSYQALFTNFLTPYLTLHLTLEFSLCFLHLCSNTGLYTLNLTLSVHRVFKLSSLSDLTLDLTLNLTLKFSFQAFNNICEQKLDLNTELNAMGPQFLRLLRSGFIHNYYCTGFNSEVQFFKLCQNVWAKNLKEITWKSQKLKWNIIITCALIWNLLMIAYYRKISVFDIDFELPWWFQLFTFEKEDCTMINDWKVIWEPLVANGQFMRNSATKISVLCSGT